MTVGVHSKFGWMFTYSSAELSLLVYHTWANIWDAITSLYKYADKYSNWLKENNLEKIFHQVNRVNKEGSICTIGWTYSNTYVARQIHCSPNICSTVSIDILLSQFLSQKDSNEISPSPLQTKTTAFNCLSKYPFWLKG